MKIHVQLFSHLRDAAKLSELTIDAREGLTVGELLVQLYDRAPALRAWDSSILVGVGVEFVSRDYVLKAGDEIAVMPPVQGG